MKSYRALAGDNHVISLAYPSTISPWLIKVLVFISLLLTLFVGNSTAQCVSPTLKFTNPVLKSGTDGAVGATYLFPAVGPGIDAEVEIKGLSGGASLAEIDNTTGAGYYDAFQPYVWAGANDTSYIDWKISFKKAGTAIDTTLGCLAVTAIDVDGDNVALKEFVEAATPGSYAVDPSTNLSVSFDGVKNKAIGRIATIPLIDTNARQAMFQMNFVNIHSLLYRNGAITTGGSQIRQTCIYFAPFFFTNWVLLPVKLTAFNVKENNGYNTINWSATDEKDMKGYSVEKSIDNKSWISLGSVAVKTDGLINSYSYNDVVKGNGVVYYRLQQMDVRGQVTYSKIIRTGSDNNPENSFRLNTVFTNKISLQVTSPTKSNMVVSVHGLNGQLITSGQWMVNQGSNRMELSLSDGLPGAIYFLSVRDSQGKTLYQSKLVKNQ